MKEMFFPRHSSLSTLLFLITGHWPPHFALLASYGKLITFPFLFLITDHLFTDHFVLFCHSSPAPWAI